MCMDKKLRKNITMDNETYNKAKNSASKLGLSFSAYLTLLINKE